MQPWRPNRMSREGRAGIAVAQPVCPHRPARVAAWCGKAAKEVLPVITACLLYYLGGSSSSQSIVAQEKRTTKQAEHCNATRRSAFAMSDEAST